MADKPLKPTAIRARMLELHRRVVKAQEELQAKFKEIESDRSALRKRCPHKFTHHWGMESYDSCDYCGLEQ